MRTESFASPLTVLVGSMRYVFAPGRDVTVGYGKGFDVPLDRPGNAPSPTPRPDVVLRFAGNQWVAIDSSPGGIFVAAAGFALVLQTSAWAKRAYVRFKRRWPRVGALIDRGMRRPSERRRREREKRTLTPAPN